MFVRLGVLQLVLRLYIYRSGMVLTRENVDLELETDSIGVSPSDSAETGLTGFGNLYTLVNPMCFL